MKTGNSAKDLYKRLRVLSWDQLWRGHVPAFRSADPTERAKNAALVRAVGVVFSECGPRSEKDDVAAWMRSLLRDSDEKIRRYAMAALPKIGAGSTEENALIDFLEKENPPERERKYLAKALDKIGGRATLHVAERLPGQTALKVRASMAREESPAEINLDRPVGGFDGLRIHLRARRGLEDFLRREIEASRHTRPFFQVAESRPGLVVISAKACFTLSDVFTLRCFGSMGLVLGTAANSDVEEIASLIVSRKARELFRNLTQGAIRYRLEFPFLGHRRGLVRDIANRAYALCPEILNDARRCPWAVEIHPCGRQFTVELRPRLSPDPRFSYRKMDVPAASHPPLAACMALLAGNSGRDVVWDPFCGSGLELIERGLLGGVTKIFGTDRSAAAINIAKSNLAASGLRTEAEFLHGDFRTAHIAPGSISQIITNPPMGRRVPIPDLAGLIADLFQTASKALQPGGTLVFANPLSMQPSDPRLKLETRRRVDLGGFDVHLERHIKIRS